MCADPANRPQSLGVWNLHPVGGTWPSRRTQAHRGHLLPRYPAVSILNSRSVQSRLTLCHLVAVTQREAPWLLLVLGLDGLYTFRQRELYHLQPSLSAVRFTRHVSVTGGGLLDFRLPPEHRGCLNLPVHDLMPSPVSEAALSLLRTFRLGALRMQIGLWKRLV